MKILSGKTAVVTGGSRGIGRAICLRLAALGAMVYINYAEWKGNGSGITFGVDTNGDGTIDDEYALQDSK